jgi:hypothetical protein
MSVQVCFEISTASEDRGYLMAKHRVYGDGLDHSLSNSSERSARSLSVSRECVRVAERRWLCPEFGRIRGVQRALI